MVPSCHLWPETVSGQEKVGLNDSVIRKGWMNGSEHRIVASQSTVGAQHSGKVRCGLTSSAGQRWAIWDEDRHGSRAQEPAPKDGTKPRLKWILGKGWWGELSVFCSALSPPLELLSERNGSIHNCRV